MTSEGPPECGLETAIRSGSEESWLRCSVEGHLHFALSYWNYCHQLPQGKKGRYSLLCHLRTNSSAASDNPPIDLSGWQIIGSNWRPNWPGKLVFHEPK